MLEFDQIKEQYPKHLQVFERAILREYLQCKILQAIFESNQASKLSFLGGTALRLFYDNQRFSEDIDLDNFGLTWDEFNDVVKKVERFLSLEGFEVEVRGIKKAAYHLYLKFPKLLYQEGLSPFRDEKVLIQVDTVAQGYDYDPEIKILNKFDVFSEIRVTPISLLLSQKIYCAVNRIRPKGRDFYDITFLFARTKPDFDYLYKKMGVNSSGQIKAFVNKKISHYDFDNLAEDVAPFLINRKEILRVKKFKEFWAQVDLG
ncbi:MAG: nucleotidyl transferase AbiEii/AbiGii toxin family protein [Chloroflexota bacterium]|nr:nucleotidyl transferase AbiEii/AbiGii toxin family protein [Chloroflexota bacterium]